MADYILSLKADVSQVKKDVESLGKSIDSLTTAAKAFAAFWISSSIINSAIEFQDQLNEVATSFKLAGITSQSATDNIADFAAEIQRTTRFSDNAVLSTASLIQGLARLDSQGLRRATQAALDLSTALRIDLNTAATMIGKAAEGNVLAFNKLGISIQKGKTDAETFQNTLNALQARFGGSALNAVNTFGGALDQLKNNFEDVIKNIGLAIIENEDLVKVVKDVSAALASLAEIVVENADTIKSLVSGSLSVLKTIFDNLTFAVTAFAGALIVLNWGSITTGVTALVSGLRILIGYFGAGTIAVTGFRIALSTIGIGLIITAVAALAQWLVNLYDKFGSVGRVVDAITLKFSKFVATITGNEQAAANYEKQLQKLGEKAEFAKQMSESVFDEQAALAQAAKKFAAEEAEAAQAAAAQRAKQLQEALQQEREASQKTIDQMKGQLKNAGLSAFDVLVRDTTAGIEAISNAVKLGVITQKEAIALREQLDADFYEKSVKLQQEAQKKEMEERKKSLETASSLFGSLTQGAAGAADLVSKGLGMVADTLLPGIGGFVTQIVGFLAQGPEKVKETITSFLQAIPTVLENIILAIPAVLMALAEQLPIVTQRLAELLPTILPPFLEALIAAIPQLAISLSLLMPRAAISFTIALIKAIPSIIEAIIIGIPTMIYEFTVGLIQAAWDFAKSLWDAIQQFIPGGGVVGAVTGGDSGGILGAVGDFFGFAEGGMVPAGYPNDSFPAKLTSGEAILPTDVVSKLDSFLSTGGGGAGQNVTINLVVGEEQLAKVMLNLNRQGFRTS